MAMKINTAKIKKEMEAQNLTMFDLSMKMRVRDQWIYQVMSGRAGRTFKAVERFAKALKVPEKDLVE